METADEGMTDKEAANDGMADERMADLNQEEKAMKYI